ncbi:MAG TPA: geranylgeranylglyceryl/heptaprenylglyceryl phosphate synthase, partial [Candidatus Goldiibacteriota bacterium]|nr:geranylgeranylglyceryl/heptaprenylglyceryl phosphate synthase [Candidatus Goldiibacteriota bacterium]
KGVTGGSKTGSSGFRMLQHAKKLSKIPVFAGFGVSDPEQAKEILKIADGVIIGSAFVSLCEKYGKNRNMLLKNAKMFVKKFLNN